ncbi:MAG: hypothetical protein P8O07_01810 [Crocinitomicaceae bacterium]|nr:hypothetical protein [Crocinitomicaceae bacterium]
MAMVKWIFICALIGCLFSCQEQATEEELYDLLLVCYNDYYESSDIAASDTLHEFENFLISEGHLQGPTGKSYRELLSYLKTNTYFKLPLKKIDFTNELLYDNPSDLIYCVHYNFNIDSAQFMNLQYYQCAQTLGEYMQGPSINIHDVFDTYIHYLDEETIEQPFVRESLLQFFYRWYFTSKYNREIEIPSQEKEAETSSESIFEDEIEVL